MIVLWNMIYVQAAFEQLRAEGYSVVEANIAHLSPYIHAQINMLGCYSFAVPDSVARGELRPLGSRATNQRVLPISLGASGTLDVGNEQGLAWYISTVVPSLR